VRKGDCTEVSTEEFRTDYPQEQRSARFITSDVSLYKFPYLTELLTVTQLSPGCQVTVLGEISRLDTPYYHVQYTDENGNEHTGYVPMTFTNPFSGLPPQQTPYQAGATESDQDAVGRLIYILLGFGAICILTDYLLLRKKRHRDETDDAEEENNV
jgi:hypothetical protein